MRCTSIAGVLVAWLAAYSIVPAQSFSPGLHAIDTPFDPRSIAAGESFVAVRGNRHAPMYNPAGLSGIEGLSLGFSRRNFNHSWYTGDFKYIALTGTVSTPLADFGIVYSRFYQGTIRLTSSQGPEPLATADLSDYVLGVTAAREIVKGLDIGLQIKTFRPVITITSGSFPGLSEANTPILVDLGLIGTLDGQITSTAVGYTASAGLAIQNFGTDLKESDPGPTTEREHILTVPRTLRAGLAFTVSTPRLGELGLSPVSIMVTAEYRHILNSRLDPKLEFWGYGAELVVLEMFSGRIGGFVPSITGIYSRQNTPSLRFGAGMRFPFGMMGLGIPLSLHADYAAIPLNKLVAIPIENSTLHSFSIELAYEAAVFPVNEE
jgi:hypothetical protein